jgi:hypothetical protein
VIYRSNGNWLVTGTGSIPDIDGSFTDLSNDSLFIPIVNNVSSDEITFFSKSDAHELNSTVGTV